MKKLLVIITTLVPVMTMASGMPNIKFSKDMMQDMQKMASCMQEIKEEDMNKLKEQSEKMSNDIKKLCENGKRKQAQSKAIKFSKKMLKSPTVKKIQKCKAPIEGVLLVDVTKDSKNENKHICDTI